MSEVTCVFPSGGMGDDAVEFLAGKELDERVAQQFVWEGRLFRGVVEIAEFAGGVELLKGVLEFGSAVGVVCATQPVHVPLDVGIQKKESTRP